MTRWESGAVRPRLDELQRLLVALGVSGGERQAILNLLATPAALKELSRQSEKAFSFPMPHQGDLLRALRLRQGFRQEDVAARLAVSQATLARWENGRSTPPPSALHELCFLLRASEEEFIALTRSSFFLADREEESGLDLETLGLSLALVEKKLLDPSYYGLGDLLYLSLEARALALATRLPAARLMLARILISHARYLSQRCQPIEAGRTAVQAMGFLPKGDDSLNVLRLKAEMYYAVWRFPLSEHANYLRPWLQRPLEVRERTWLMGQMAASLLEQHAVDDALVLESQALELVRAKGDPYSIMSRQNNYAETMMEVGRPAEAVELFMITDAMDPAMRLRTKLSLAEAHLANRNASRARDFLSDALADHAVLGISYYQPQINALVQKL